MEDGKKKNYHDGHRRRMIESLLSVDDVPLTDVQFIEMILFYCIPRVDTNIIAHRLLERFGDINGIFSASEKELAKVHGIGDISAKKILKIGEIAGEYSRLKKLQDHGGLTKKRICDAILIFLRETILMPYPWSPFFIFCISQSGEVLFRKSFCKNSDACIRLMDILHSEDNDVLRLFCVAEQSLRDHAEARVEFESLYPDALRKYKFDAVAYISSDFLVRFELLNNDNSS